MVEIYWDDLTEEKQRATWRCLVITRTLTQFPITVLLEPEEAEDFYLS